MKRRVFGLFPVKGSGERFGFLEVDEKTHRRFKRRADKSGLSVGEEMAFHMEREGLTATRTGERCGLPGKEVAA